MRAALLKNSNARSVDSVPFTPTHILATIPIARVWNRPAAVAGLVIGSMIPDWPLYIPVGPDYAQTHTFSGIILACLPLGLFVTMIYLVFLRQPLFELLPLGLRQRLVPYHENRNNFDALSLLHIAAAVSVGALTHIVWDAFTHGNAWGVAMIPETREIWLSVTGVKFPGYMVLQHGSSVIGLPLLTLLFVIWYRKATVNSPAATIISVPTRVAWSVLIAGIPLGVLVKQLIDVERVALWPILKALYYGATSSGFVLVVLVACYGLLFYPVVRYRVRRNHHVPKN